MMSPSSLTSRSPSSSSKSSSRKIRTSFSGSSNITTSQLAVVIEFGNAFLRIGFSGESTPRCIIPSPIPLLKPTEWSDHGSIAKISTEEEWEEILTKLLDDVCLGHLLIRPRHHRFLLLEPVVTPTSFRRAISKVLLKTMQVPSLLFLSDPAICPLHTRGWRYGIVIDMGRYETRTVSSFNGRSLPNTFQAVPVGYENVLAHLQTKYNTNIGENDDESNHIIPNLEDAHSIMEQCLSQHHSLTNSSDTEDPSAIMMNCTIPSTQQKLNISIQDIIDVWKDTCFDLSNPNSITYAFLSTVLATPMDLRKVLLKHICIVGGGASMLATTNSSQHHLSFSKLFMNSFHVNILQLKENIRFQKLIPPLSICDSMSVVGGDIDHCPFHPSLMNWIGASILGATMELNDERWVHRNVFLRAEGYEYDDEDEDTSEIVGSANDGDGSSHLIDWMNVRK